MKHPNMYLTYYWNVNTYKQLMFNNLNKEDVFLNPEQVIMYFYRS